MHKNKARRLISVILIGVMLCISLTGCADKRKQEVDAYNSYTEDTINDYQALSQMLEGREEYLITSIKDGNIPAEWLSTAPLDYSAESEMLRGAEVKGISSEPVITTTGLFTSLGANSCIQLTQFTLAGTAFTLEVLWSDSKIEALTLEKSKG